VVTKGSDPLEVDVTERDRRRVTADANLEENIVHLAQSGAHDDAVAALIKGYGAEIYGFLAAMLGPVDAEDAFSIFAEQIVRGIAAFRFQSSVRTWAYAVARHAAFNLKRDRARARRRLVDGSRADSAVDKAVAAVRTRTSDVMKTEVKDAVRELREALDEDERELLTLRVDRGFAWTEIAKIVDAEAEPEKKAAALRKQYERVKAKLKKLAIERGIRK
jgi:RNA polymerase sigma-70 factor (ECF subfamily)